MTKKIENHLKKNGFEVIADAYDNAFNIMYNDEPMIEGFKSKFEAYHTACQLVDIENQILGEK